MSSASFGTVNATGLNVTGVLQASEVRTTRPMQVSNLTVTGAITNSAFNTIDMENLVARQKFDPSEAYNKSAMRETQTGCHNDISQKNTMLTLTFRNSDGSINEYLSNNTPWCDLDPLDAFGNPAPLVKLNDDLTYTYINVASNTNADIITEFLAPTQNNFVVSIKGQEYFVDQKMIADGFAGFIAYYIKRGYILPGKGGVRGYDTRHVFYNDLLSDGFIRNSLSDNYFGIPPSFVDNNMSIGIDVNPYIADSAHIDLYMFAGFNGVWPLALPDAGIDYKISVPRFRMTVTTDPLAYTAAKAAGTNSMYLNTKTWTLNILITDFDGYHFDIPTGNIFSNTVSSCVPSYFEGSFGFYRNFVPVPDESHAYVPMLSTSNLSTGVRLDVFDGKNPLSTNPTTAEFMMQTSDTIRLDYAIDGTANTVSIPLRYNINVPDVTPPPTESQAHPELAQTNRLVDSYTGFTLPSYVYGDSNVNIMHISSAYSKKAAAYEGIEFPLTYGSNVGTNENLTAFEVKNATSETTHQNINRVWKYINSDLNVFPCASSNIFTPSTLVPYESTPSINREETFTVYPRSADPNSAASYVYNSSFLGPHETFHAVEFGLGLSPQDQYNNIYDDETMADLCSSWDYGKLTYTGASAAPFLYSSQIIRNFVYGAALLNTAISSDVTTGNTYALRSTPFQWVQDGNENGVVAGDFYRSYSSALFSAIIKASYDPNIQHHKLFTILLAKEFAEVSEANLLRVQQSTGRTVNPSIVQKSLCDAIEATHMHAPNGSLITNAQDLVEESLIKLIVGRNNPDVPDKYKSMLPLWYTSTYSNVWIQTLYASNATSPSVDIAVRVARSPTFNMADWDFTETNEDYNSLGTETYASYYPDNVIRNTPCMPWWPKNSGADMADYSYQSMANTAATFCTAPLTRYLYALQSAGYALPLGLSNVTVTLTELVDSNLMGAYNQNVSVVVFKYVPNICIGGSPSVNGTFLMKGPYTLSGNGSNVVIDLTDTFSTSIPNKFTSVGTHAGSLSFNQSFDYGVDTAAAYTPPETTTAYANHLAMSGGNYQPVTRLLITNKQVDTINFNDPEEALFLDQVFPATFTVQAL